MGAWAPVYSDEQRGAIEDARLVHGITNTARIVRMAAAGDLSHDGQKVSPFEIPYQSAVYIVKRAERRRQGRQRSPITALSPKDAGEQLRQRLACLTDAELARAEKRQAQGKPVDPEHLRKLTRLAREIATFPGVNDVRLPVAAHARDTNGRQANTAALDNQSLARSILAASQPQPTDTPPPTPTADTALAAPTPVSTTD